MTVEEIAKAIEKLSPKEAAELQKRLGWVSGRPRDNQNSASQNLISKVIVDDDNLSLQVRIRHGSFDSLQALLKYQSLLYNQRLNTRYVKPIASGDWDSLFEIYATNFMRFLPIGLRKAVVYSIEMSRLHVHSSPLTIIHDDQTLALGRGSLRDHAAQKIARRLLVRQSDIKKDLAIPIRPPRFECSQEERKKLAFLFKQLTPLYKNGKKHFKRAQITTLEGFQHWCDSYNAELEAKTGIKLEKDLMMAWYNLDPLYNYRPTHPAIEHAARLSIAGYKNCALGPKALLDDPYLPGTAKKNRAKKPGTKKRRS